MTLTLVHPQRLSSFSVLPANTYWLYADDNLYYDGQAHRQFGRAQRLVEPVVFQTRAAQLRGAFMEWVDRSLASHVAEDWIPASYFKDIFTAPVFLHCVCLVLLDEALRQGKAVVVISSSKALSAQLNRLVRTYGQTLIIFGAACFRREAWRIKYLAWRHFLLRPLRLLASVILARQILGNRQIERLKNVQILVATPLLNGDLEETGKHSDRFLPGLIDYYRAQGFVAASLACTENLSIRCLSAAYRAMRISQTLFAPGELFLQWQDIFGGQWRAQRAMTRLPAFSTLPFMGIDVSCIADFWWPVAIRRTVVARIMTVLEKRMRSCGLNPRLFLIWYENQPLDKALQIGVCLSDQKSQVVAVRQYFPAENVLSFFSSTGEVRHGVSPKTNWVCGKRTAELFARHDSEGIYLPVPALRYAHLFPQFVATEVSSNLVVFLTSSLEESLSILECVFANVDQAMHHFSAIRVKSHQALKDDIAVLAHRRWPSVRAPVIWEQAASSKLLPDAALVLTAGSSVAVEALCCGIPVVLVGRTSGLDVNPLEDIDNADWRIVYFSEEFAALLENWLPHLPPIQARQARGQEIRNTYFDPSTEKNMRVFLPT